MRVRRTIRINRPNPLLSVPFELDDGAVHARVFVDHILVQIIDCAVGLDVVSLQTNGEQGPVESWLTDEIREAGARCVGYTRVRYSHIGCNNGLKRVKWGYHWCCIGS